MNAANVRQFLRLLGVSASSITSSSEGWVTAPCPLAPWLHKTRKDKHPSFAIKADVPESFFHCFTCESGDLYFLIQRLAMLGAESTRYNLTEATKLVDAETDEELVLNLLPWGAKPETVVPWPEAWLEGYPPAEKVKVARQYLRSRGVMRQTRLELDIRWDAKRRIVLFPYRDWNGYLVGARGRRLEPEEDQPKYFMYGHNKKRNKLPWMGENTVNPDEPVLMVESVFDMAAVWPVYHNVVSPLTAGIGRTKVLRMERLSRVVTLFDADSAGDKARKKIDMFLPQCFVRHCHLPPWAKDPGDLKTPEIYALLLDFLPLKK